MSIDRLYRGFPPFGQYAEVAIDGVTWDRYTESLRAAREKVSGDAQRNVYMSITKAAAIDTGAIEGLYEVDRGFTITTASLGATFEAVLEADKGVGVRDMVRAHLRAYDLALDIATNNTPISEALIRRIHEEACAAQETYSVRTPTGARRHDLPKGVYKRQPNHVELADGAVHAYAPVLETPAEMARLVAELSGLDFVRADPVLQAAYAHYGLVAIHPFADGNGRVARVLSSTYLFRAESIPLLIFADQRPGYLDALERADRGDHQAFVSYVFERAIDAIALATEGLRSAGSANPGSASAGLRDALRAHGELTHQQVDDVASRVLNVLAGVINTKLSELGMPREVQASTGFLSDAPTWVPTGYRAVVTGNRLLRVSIASPAPAEAHVSSDISVLVATDPSAREHFLIARESPTDTLLLRLEDVHPQVSATVMYRLGLLAERVIGDVVTQATEQSQRSLGKHGY